MNAHAARTVIAQDAIKARPGIDAGYLSRDDVARRHQHCGLGFAQVRAVVDDALDGRRAHQVASAGTVSPGEHSQAEQVAARAASTGTGLAVVGIGATKLPVASINGERVITLSMMDHVHQRPEGTAGRNFREHEAKLIPGEDFLRVSTDEIRRHNLMELSPKARGEIVLLTESGYLMLVKAFTDPLAWQVQRQMVSIYFRAKDAGGSAAALPHVPIDQGKLIGGVVKAVAGKIAAESEARVLAHTEAMMRAEIAAMEHRLLIAMRGLPVKDRTDAPVAEQCVGAGDPAADIGGVSWVTGLAVVRLVLPNALHARSLAQIASAGLRRQANAMGQDAARNSARRHVFPGPVAEAWLDTGGRDRLLSAAQ